MQAMAELAYNEQGVPSKPYHVLTALCDIVVCKCSFTYVLKRGASLSPLLCKASSVGGDYL